MIGEYEIEALAERIRKLPELAAKVAPDCARVVAKEIERTTAAGTDSYGVPWAPKKKDGGKPLINAFAAVTVGVTGKTILILLKGVNAKHHLGAVKGKVQRAIVPRSKLGIPITMVAGIDDVISKAFVAAVVQP
jgi:hypothetical protein